MRTHGWGGDPPADDDEAVERILAAARRGIEQRGGDTSIVDVAKELGVTRQTVYRYFRSTDALLTAAARTETAAYFDRLRAHVESHPGTPSEVVVEAMAFTLDQLPHEPFMGLVLQPALVGALGKGVTSETSRALGRSMLDRLPVDWEAQGFDDIALDDLVEHLLRVVQSFVIDPGTPRKRGPELRAYLTRWIAPAIDAHTTSRPPSARRGSR